MNDHAQNATARTYWKIERLGTSEHHHDAGVVDKFGRRVGFQVRITEQRWIPTTAAEGGYLEKGGQYAVMITITRDGARYGASQPEKQFDGFTLAHDYSRAAVAKRIAAARKKFDPVPAEERLAGVSHLADDVTGDAGDACEARDDCTDIPGTHFRIRLVRQGETYGRDNCLTHDKADPLAEIYDSRFPHTDRGQFVARYYRSTLLEHPMGCGIDLDGRISEWSIDAVAFSFVRGWLTATI